MAIATIGALAVICLSIAVYEYAAIRKMKREIDGLYSALAQNAENESLYRARVAVRLDKLEAGAAAVEEFSANTGKGLSSLEETVEKIGQYQAQLEKKMDDAFELFRNTLEELCKTVEGFDELTQESVRAQLDAEKAWAEGVRNVTSFGAQIPTLKVAGLSHE